MGAATTGRETGAELTLALTGRVELAGRTRFMESMMDLHELRRSYERQIEEHEKRIQSMRDKDIRHFRQEGEGPLAEITEEIKAEYHRHIETYAALIAEIDAILGV